MQRNGRLESTSTNRKSFASNIHANFFNKITNTTLPRQMLNDSNLSSQLANHSASNLIVNRSSSAISQISKVTSPVKDTGNETDSSRFENILENHSIHIEHKIEDRSLPPRFKHKEKGRVSTNDMLETSEDLMEVTNIGGISKLMGATHHNFKAKGGLEIHDATLSKCCCSHLQTTGILRTSPRTRVRPSCWIVFSMSISPVRIGCLLFRTTGQQKEDIQWSPPSLQ